MPRAKRGASTPNKKWNLTPQPGVITPNEKWKLTPKREAALKRLVELGVNVYSTSGSRPGTDFTLLVPHDLNSVSYIEVGYLIAQLGEEEFPQYYACLSDTATEIFEHKRGDPLPVYFVDSYMHGLKYRVNLQD